MDGNTHQSTKTITTLTLSTTHNHNIVLNLPIKIQCKNTKSFMHPSLQFKFIEKQEISENFVVFLIQAMPKSVERIFIIEEK